MYSLYLTNDQNILFLFCRSESPHVRLMMATTLMAAGKPEETLDGIHYTSFILEKVGSQFA